MSVAALPDADQMIDLAPVSLWIEDFSTAKWRADMKMLHAKRLYHMQANRDRQGVVV